MDRKELLGKAFFIDTAVKDGDCRKPGELTEDFVRFRDIHKVDQGIEATRLAGGDEGVEGFYGSAAKDNGCRSTGGSGDVDFSFGAVHAFKVGDDVRLDLLLGLETAGLPKLAKMGDSLGTISFD